jgi:hypothetical protein
MFFKKSTPDFCQKPGVSKFVVLALWFSRDDMSKNISKKRKFVADGVFFAELNQVNCCVNVEGREAQCRGRVRGAGLGRARRPRDGEAAWGTTVCGRLPAAPVSCAAVIACALLSPSLSLALPPRVGRVRLLRRRGSPWPDEDGDHHPCCPRAGRAGCVRWVPCLLLVAARPGCRCGASCTS